MHAAAGVLTSHVPGTRSRGLTRADRRRGGVAPHVDADAAEGGGTCRLLTTTTGVAMAMTDTPCHQFYPAYLKVIFLTED